jgi:hypothetical protein
LKTGSETDMFGVVVAKLKILLDIALPIELWSRSHSAEFSRVKGRVPVAGALSLSGLTVSWALPLRDRLLRRLADGYR